MLLYGTIKYYMDESSSIVDAKEFHDTKDDIYPVVTLCLEMDFKPNQPFTDPKHTLPLYSYSSEKNKDFEMTLEEIRDYVSFTMGVKESDSALTYDYDNITLDVNDYLNKISVKSGEDVLYSWDEREKSNQSKPMFISYRHPLVKCYSLELSKVIGDTSEKATKITQVSIFFSNTNTKLFGSKSEMKMAQYMHYPKQLMRSTALDRDHLGITHRDFAKLFYVDGIEVIRRRNTRVTPCDENYQREDEMIRKRLVEREGCAPSYWRNDIKEYKNPCKKASEMSKLVTPNLESIDPSFHSQFKKEAPCSQIYGIAYTFKSLHSPPDCKGMCGPPHKSIDFNFKSIQYKEIKHVQAFTVEGFIGNAGGYVGLFIGCCFWQIPDLFGYVYRQMI